MAQGFHFGYALPPVWPSEPSLIHLEAIARQHLGICADIPCTVTPFAQGGFNKLYTISTPAHAHAQTYLIRVALPVEPRLKTLSEVATIEFARAHATEVVPRIVAYEADAEACELGYEWMLMERLAGGPLEEQWKSMKWEAKTALVKTLVDISARLYEHPLRGIGNIYPDASIPVPISASECKVTPDTGRIVSMMFFWDHHYDQDVPRGPFRSSHDWLDSCLRFTLIDSANVLARPPVENGSDEDEREEAQLTQARVFPPSETGAAAEPTIVHHDDLSFHNVLVDESGSLTGIVDWECVSALPLWYACSLPSFLQGRTRTMRPDAQTY